MYRIGSIVTLLESKSHGEGEYAMNIAAGVVGLIVSYRGQEDGGTDSERTYVVDFGSEAQWNCTHSELHAESESPEELAYGEDEDGEVSETYPPEPATIPEPVFRSTPPERNSRSIPDIDKDKEPKMPNFEKDLKKAMEEAEKKDKKKYTSPF